MLNKSQLPLSLAPRHPVFSSCTYIHTHRQIHIQTAKRRNMALEEQHPKLSPTLCTCTHMQTRKYSKLGMVVHTCLPSTWGAETGGLVSGHHGYIPKFKDTTHMLKFVITPKNGVMLSRHTFTLV